MTRRDEAGTPSATRTPPREVLEWYARFGGGAVEDAARPSTGTSERALEERLRGGLAALGEALRRTGRDREGAYALLAADGLLTDAVLAGVEAEDPDAAFRAILAAVGREATEDER